MLHTICWLRDGNLDFSNKIFERLSRRFHQRIDPYHDKYCWTNIHQKSFGTVVHPNDLIYSPQLYGANQLDMVEEVIETFT